MFSVNNSSKITVSLIWLVFLVAYLWTPVAGAKSYLIFVGLSVIMYAVLDYYYSRKLNFRGYAAYIIVSVIGIITSLYLYTIF